MLQKHEHPFLDVEPPHLVVRGLAYILILLFVSGLVAAVVVQVPETVSAPFVLVPVRGTDPVRALRAGTVISVAVTESQSVDANDSLLVIESQLVGDRSADRQTFEAQARGARASLENAKSRYELQQLADEADARRLETRATNLTRTLELKRKQLATTTDLVGRHRELHTRGLTTLEDVAKSQLEADGLAVELESSQTELAETQAALAKLERDRAVRAAEFEELTRKLHEDIATAEIRIDALERDSAGTVDNRLVVRAPCRGVVLRLKVRSAGAVVQEGETLGEVACGDERLQAELTVPQSGVGLVKAGQGVKLLYDAFPYQRYGVRSGEIRWVSPASVSVAATPAFLARADIDRSQVMVNGQPRALTPGMAGQAQVVVGKRSLISFAFEPLRQLKESLSDVPRTDAKGQG
jgi:multidrug efflux pump subunit AcrA (membrane-fusion protein)